jgi:hypothetical protein
VRPLKLGFSVTKTQLSNPLRPPKLAPFLLYSLVLNTAYYKPTFPKSHIGRAKQTNKQMKIEQMKPE